MIIAILMIAAFVLLVLGIFPIPARFNLVAAGLACWALATLIGVWPAG